MSATIGTVTLLLVWATLAGPGPGSPVLVDWPSGLGAEESSRRLASRGLVRSPRLMTLYLRLFGPSTPLVPGPHVLKDSLSPRQIVEHLGRLRTRPVVKVTLPEGWHHQQIAQRLEESGVCSAQSFRRACNDPALLRRLGVPAATAEGYLFPSTYQMRVDTAAEAVVGRLVHEAKERLHRLSGLHPKAMARLREQFNWSTHEVIILASIVEKEAAAADEQRLVASVFFNRLLDREFRPARRLQSDPTAAYGCMVAPGRAPSCKASARGVTASMLRDAANPYNTYAHPGLPPGPIGNPGESAILAVLDPAQTDFLFFVARGAGRHHFSRTLEQHNQAIRQIGR